MASIGSTRVHDYGPELFTLRVIEDLRRSIDRAEYEVVQGLRAAGVPWEAIGAVYGITLQAAQQRFSRLRHRQRR